MPLAKSRKRYLRRAMEPVTEKQQRRTFVGLSSLALAGATAALAQDKTRPAAAWSPARHGTDDWLERPSQHRIVFDTTTFEGAGVANVFATNFVRVNGTDYGLKERDLAVLIVLRHRSTPLGYNDAMWAKYGAPMAAQARFSDPKTQGAPKVNLYNSKDHADTLENRGVTFDALVKQGVTFAVCSLATRVYAAAIAKAMGGNVDAINQELVANLIANARMVTAGIVVVSRAQERGYTLVTA